jgi:dihydrofolate synthase/folylpolyglutamate synthase
LTGAAPRPPDPALARRKREVEAEIFARRPEHAVEPTLDRISALATLLGDPQRACPVIHVTGTNGKTSTARMIETLLRARGLRTGLFTSPHLSDIRERIVIDGEPLPLEAFLACYDDVAPYVALVDEREPVRLSFFEVLTAMAFAAFADAPVDVAVVEVGLGGTWDATNIADGAVGGGDAGLHRPHPLPGRHDRGDRGGEGGHHQARRGRRPRPAASRGRRGAAAPRRRRWARPSPGGLEFGVVRRELAVGGQVVALRGLAWGVRRPAAAAVRRVPGHERRLRAGRGRGVRQRRARR